MFSLWWNIRRKTILALQPEREPQLGPKQGQMWDRNWKHPRAPLLHKNYRADTNDFLLQLYSYIHQRVWRSHFSLHLGNVKVEVWVGCKDKSQANYSVSGNQVMLSFSVTLQLDTANLSQCLKPTWMSCCWTHCLLSRLRRMNILPGR